MQNCAEDEFMIQKFAMSFVLDLPKKTTILVIWPLVLSENPNFVWQAKKPWFVKLLGCKYSPLCKRWGQSSKGCYESCTYQA
jgi:hypothetical protein